MDEETRNYNRKFQMMIRQISFITMVFMCQLAIAQSEPRTDHFNSLQTISFVGENDSFQQNLRAIVRSTTLHEEKTSLYRMAFEGGITFPSVAQPTVGASEESVVVRNENGVLQTDDPALLRTVAVINSGVNWATSHSLPENKQLRIPIDLGNGITSYALMTFDSEPVAIGAGDDTRLVTVRSDPRRVSGRGGVFTCQYSGMFIYSPKNDQLYQSTSVFTANNGKEQFRLEEQTFLTAISGAAPRYELVDYKNRLGTFSAFVEGHPMTSPPPPWVMEAMAARESLYCQGKAIVYQKTNWVFVSAFIANTTNALMNYAWNTVAGETLITSVRNNYPEIGSRLQHLDLETIECNANTLMKASQMQLTSTVASESASLGAKYVAITPDAKPAPTPSSTVPIAAAGGDWLSTVLLVGGAGAAVAMGSSSSGGGSTACAGSGLIGNYTVTLSSPCMMGTTIPSSDISLSLSLNSSCSVTGTANVYLETPAVTATTWSHSDGILTIGSFTSPVAESATTFETPLEQIFPAVAAAVLATFDLLPLAERDEIITNCGSPEAYVSGLQMTWVR